MGQVLFVLGNILAAAVAYVAADLAMRDREPWRRALAAIAGFPVVVLFVLLALGNLGHLSASAAVLTVGTMAAAAMSIRLRAAKTDARPLAPQEHRTGYRESDRIFWPLSLALMAGFGGVWIFLLGVQGTLFSFDDLSYHAPAVAQWIAEGRISLAPFNYHAYYPFNAEILSLWFMLPLHADGLAGLSGLYWGILLAASAAALVMAQAQSWATGMFVGALLLASPPILAAAHTFSASDLAGPALVLAALALAIPSPDNHTNRANFTDATYSGLLAGFAVGCKIAFAPVVAVIFVWFLFGRLRSSRPGVRIGSVTAFAAASAATGAYWYLRNWLLTGNPLFPAAIGPFDGPFGGTEQSRTTLIHWILAFPRDRSQWISLIEWHASWPYGLFLLVFVGYGASLRALVWNRRVMGADNSAVQRLLLLTGMALFVSYPFLPFSGTDNDPHGPLRIELRFLIGCFAIGIVLFSSCLRGDHRHRRLWAAVATIAVVSSVQANGTLFFVIVGAGMMGLLVALLARRISFPRHLGPAIRLTALLGILLPIVLLTPHKQRLTDLGLFGHGEQQHPIGHAWQALDGLPDGSQVTWFGPSAYQYYPVFGRELQLTPIPVNGDGSGYQPLHEVFRRQRIQWWPDEHNDPDLGNLVPNLIANGVGYALVTKWNLDKWPREQEALAKSGRATSIYNDGYSAIWRMQSAAE